MKIAIIGTGRVGSSIVYGLVLKQSCDHLVIAGRSYEKARGRCTGSAIYPGFSVVGYNDL